MHVVLKRIWCDMCRARSCSNIPITYAAFIRISLYCGIHIQTYDDTCNIHIYVILIYTDICYVYVMYGRCVNFLSFSVAVAVLARKRLPALGAQGGECLEGGCHKMWGLCVIECQMISYCMWHVSHIVALPQPLSCPAREATDMGPHMYGRAARAWYGHMIAYDGIWYKLF